MEAIPANVARLWICPAVALSRPANPCMDSYLYLYLYLLLSGRSDGRPRLGSDLRAGECWLNQQRIALFWAGSCGQQ